MDFLQKGSKILGQTKRGHRANEIYPVKKPTPAFDQGYLN